jgi:dihydroorotate dehydrogenase
MRWLYKKILRRILFLFDAELAHKIALQSLLILNRVTLLPWFLKTKKNKKSNDSFCILNLSFKNKIGIAAGLDKNGDYISVLAGLDPAFIELGTVTPRPQPGNLKPRLFRLEKEEAIINRMGFNNLGVDYLVNNVNAYKKSLQSRDVIIGINIGKNFDTPLEFAINDYLICFKKAYLAADYISINISSPNTEKLRDLQQVDYLDNLLNLIKQEQANLYKKHNKYTPIALKIAPDLKDDEIKQICDLCLQYKIELIIVANTTIEHELLIDSQGSKIPGGLSGRPLFVKSNDVLKKVAEYIKNDKTYKIFIIGVGGINSAADAIEKLELGADLVQVYSGLVYQGASLISDIISATKN